MSDQNNDPQQISQNTFAHFKILSELGRGGMGCVYKAFDTKLQRVVALKVLIAQDQAGAKQIQRFLIEAQATAKLMHPHIVRVYEIGQHNKTTFFTMDYINGISLKELIKTKKLTLRSGVKLIKKVAQGMHHAHQKGIIHRDLKPANIMIDDKNEPYVMDFGLAKVMDSDKNLTKTGTIMGTLFYMPPEQAEGQHRQIDQRSDIYSLGAILYEIITGRVPHHANSTLSLLKKITLEPIEPPSKVKKNLPKTLEYICLKALAKKKEDRYQDANELAQDLENFNANKSVKGAKGNLWHKISIGIASLLLLLGLIWWTMSPSKTKPKEVSKKAPSLSINRSIKQHIALVIGNAKYTKIPLQNAVNDAVSIANVLKKLRFEVTLLTNASMRKMKEEIRSFGDKLKQKKAAALFYYAGHGVQVKGLNYLIPVDSDIKREDEVPHYAINAGLVLDKMESANTAINLVFLDACRDNPFVTNSRSTSRGLARMDAPHGSLISYATAPGKTASDGDGEHGVFTKHLLRFIQEPGLEVGKIMRKVRQAVRLETGGEQIPWDSSSLEGDFFFLPPKGKAIEVASKKESKKPKKSQKINQIAGFEYMGENTYFSQRHTVKEYQHNKTGMKFVLIPGGTFSMGSTDGHSNEKPVHKVKLDPFLMSKTEVTQEVYERIIGNNPSRFKGAKRPVELVSWNDAKAFCDKVGLRLPTEAQWEYAARAGTTGKYYWGNGDIQDYCWYNSNSDNKTHDVALKRHNAFGLYDMSGNVWEWCSDWYGNYSSSYQVNPVGPPNGSKRVHRGGCYIADVRGIRSARHAGGRPDDRDPSLGFRLSGRVKRKINQIAGFKYMGENTYFSQRHTVKEYRHNKTGIEFVQIPGGIFLMGSANGDNNEKPVHRVELRSFLISKTEVTQEVYKRIMGNNPSNFKGAKRPVEQVTWNDAKAFCDKVGLHLPTEAQWEYAARAGTTGKYYWGSGDINDYCWYNSNSDSKTHDVALKEHNAFGLYDMSGSVWEWCSDWYGNYSSGYQTNPIGTSNGSQRVERGGGYSSNASYMRSATRYRYRSDYRSGSLGFRVVSRAIPKKQG